MGFQPDELQRRIGYRFSDPEVLRQALTHASACSDPRHSNETLEFLGDAVIDVVVAEKLFRDQPALNEGEMTAIKSVVVARVTLAKVGERLGLQGTLHVGGGLEQRGGNYPESLLANAYEAVVGAVFIDGGHREAHRFVLRTLGKEIEKARRRQHEPDYKSLLQRQVQGLGKEAPVYEIIHRTGPEHKPAFRAAVCIEDQQAGTGWGQSKKQAEQKAAEAALDHLFPDWREARDVPAE